MSVIVEFTLSPERLTLAEAIAAVPSVSFEIEREYPTPSNEPIVFAWVRGDPADLDAFERAAESDDSVTNVSLLADHGDRRLYRGTGTGEAEVLTYSAWVGEGVERLDMRYADGRWHARMRFPDREALSEFRAFCDREDLDFELVRLYDLEADRETPRDGLTDLQREALRLAFDREYFGVPRGTTTGDLAAELGISDQAVSERLRRGCARLIENRML